MKHPLFRNLAILVIASLLLAPASLADSPSGKQVVSNSQEAVTEQVLVYPGNVVAPGMMPSGELALAPSQVAGVPIIVTVPGGEFDSLRLFSPGINGTVIPASAPQPSGEESWYFGRPDAASLDWSNTFYAWAKYVDENVWGIRAAIGNHFAPSIGPNLLITDTWGWNGNAPTVRAAAGPDNVMTVCFRHGNGDLVCTWANQLNDLPGNMQTIVDIAGSMGTVNLHTFDVAVDPTSLRPVVTYITSDQSNEPALLVGLQLNTNGTTTQLFALEIEGAVDDVQTTDVGADFAVAILHSNDGSCTTELTVINRSSNSNHPYYGWKEIGGAACESGLGVANAGEQGVLVAYNGVTGGIQYGYSTPKGAIRQRGWVSNYQGDQDPTAMCSPDYQSQILCQVLYNYSADHSVWRTELEFPRNGDTGTAAGIAYVDTNGNGVYDLGIDQALPDLPVCLEHESTGAQIPTTTWINGEFSFNDVPIGAYTAIACPTVALNYLPDPFQWVHVEADIFIDGQHVAYHANSLMRGLFLPLIIRE